MSKITVKDTEINVTKINSEDYICITDMLKAKDGEFFITDWLRNRNTLEYIGTWESVYNPNFDFDEFSKITSRSGLNNFKISVKEFVEKTNAVSITAKAGRYGGAYAIEDCWKLVNTYEETKTPFMFLENCCFGRREMMTRTMLEKGLLGEIIHCSGSYAHDLRDEISHGNERNHYRLRNYLNRNCENYPTHDLGPIAKILKINHGNRLLSLTSTASKSKGLKEYIKSGRAEAGLSSDTDFMQGDIITTVLKTTLGETIVLTLDTTLPRYYSRGFTVRGTKGMYEEATDSVFIDRKEDHALDMTWRKECIGNAVDYEAEYDHPIWKEYLDEGVKGAHDGMDYLEFKIFFDCLLNNKSMPVDVYDAATWMAISPLSEQSIACGSAPVEIPDFTRGKWVLE